jgi:hypothetical protein
MGRSRNDKTSFRRRLPALFLVAGFGMFGIGAAIEIAGLGPAIMQALGFGGTAFGLLAKAGGPMVFAGLFAVAVRPPANGQDDGMAPPRPDRLARAAAAAARQNRQRPPAIRRASADRPA